MMQYYNDCMLSLLSKDILYIIFLLRYDLIDWENYYNDFYYSIFSRVII